VTVEHNYIGIKIFFEQNEKNKEEYNQFMDGYSKNGQYGIKQQ
jgi:hypothetical protein